MGFNFLAKGSLTGGVIGGLAGALVGPGTQHIAQHIMVGAFSGLAAPFVLAALFNMCNDCASYCRRSEERTPLSDQSQTATAFHDLGAIAPTTPAAPSHA